MSNFHQPFDLVIYAIGGIVYISREVERVISIVISQAEYLVMKLWKRFGTGRENTIEDDE